MQLENQVIELRADPQDHLAYDLDRLEAGLPNVEIAWGYVPSANHTQYRAERRASAEAARAAHVGH